MTTAARTLSLFGAILLFGSVCGISAAEQRKQEVDLLLVLAIDASGSIDKNEWDLEKRGYAEALLDPEVLRAIHNGPIGAIGIAAIKWGNPNMQELVVPWTIIDGESAAEDVASTLSNLPYNSLGKTSLGYGILRGITLIEQSPYASIRHVIDVSGDGMENTIRMSDLLQIREFALSKKITINGLPIVTPDGLTLEEYYKNYVIGGPGAFVVVAKDFSSFATAIRKKLITEIAGEMSALQFATN